MAQGLGLCASTAEGMGSIPGQGTKKDPEFCLARPKQGKEKSSKKGGKNSKRAVTCQRIKLLSGVSRSFLSGWLFGFPQQTTGDRRQGASPGPQSSFPPSLP